MTNPKYQIVDFIIPYNPPFRPPLWLHPVSLQPMAWDLWPPSALALLAPPARPPAPLELVSPLPRRVVSFAGETVVAWRRQQHGGPRPSDPWVSVSVSKCHISHVGCNGYRSKAKKPCHFRCISCLLHSNCLVPKVLTYPQEASAGGKRAPSASSRGWDLGNIFKLRQELQISAGIYLHANAIQLNFPKYIKVPHMCIYIMCKCIFVYVYVHGCVCICIIYTYLSLLSVFLLTIYSMSKLSTYCVICHILKYM